MAAAASVPRRPAAPPLVLLPGLNCSGALWSGLNIGPAHQAELTESSLGAQVDRLLDELPPRFDLVGLSLGAIIATAVARTAPHRVERLSLLAVNPRAPTKAQRSAWSRQRLDLAGGGTARELQQALLPDLLSPASLTDCPDLVALTLAMADAVGTEGLDRQLQLQASRIDERPGLARLTCPTLVLAADGDRLVSLAKQREVHDLVTGSHLVMLSGCAHLCTLERPEQVSAALRTWRALQIPVSPA